MPDWLSAVAIGFVSGMLSGMFGIGGGIITTPGIRLLLGAPALVAVGTPLPVIFPSAITGSITYMRAGLTNVRAALWLGGAGAATAVLGAVLATRAGGTVVLIGTAALILWAAIDMVLQMRHSAAAVITAEEAEAAEAPALCAETAPSAPLRPPAAVLVGIGAVAGLYSGFFGLGGGFILVPLMTRWLKFPIKVAIATSLMAVALLAVPGTVTHALLGNVDWVIATGLTVGVIPGALVGSHVALGASERWLRWGFVTLLAVTGTWLAVSEIGALL